MEPRRRFSPSSVAACRLTSFTPTRSLQLLCAHRSLSQQRRNTHRLLKGGGGSAGIVYPPVKTKIPQQINAQMRVIHAEPSSCLTPDGACPVHERRCHILQLMLLKLPFGSFSPLFPSVWCRDREGLWSVTLLAHRKCDPWRHERARSAHNAIRIIYLLPAILSLHPDLLEETDGN